MRVAFLGGAVLDGLLEVAIHSLSMSEDPLRAPLVLRV